MGLVVDGVRVVELAVVPQHLAQRRVGLGHGEHPLRVAALRHQLPAGGRGVWEHVQVSRDEVKLGWTRGQTERKDVRFSHDGTCDRRARLAYVPLSVPSF